MRPMNSKSSRSAFSNRGTRCSAATPRGVSPRPVAPVPPRSIEEVDKTKILGYGANLDASHPGYSDEEFKNRRMEIAQIAYDYVDGTPIPEVAYNPAELGTWARVLRDLRPLHEGLACAEYNAAAEACGFREDEVPQLEDMSAMLHKATGWRVRPAAGLLHPRAFLNGLAFKTFHSTQYVRHHSSPHYTPEPDVCHELLGHVPMLTDEGFADCVQAIGEASLRAPDEDIWHLVKVYWYTVEFGVVRQGGKHRAFGAGVLSSIAEMENLRSGDEDPASSVRFEPFNPFAMQPKMSYNEGTQQRYFVLDLERNDVRAFSEHMARLHARGQSHVEQLRARQSR